jgi:hypothetical protein
MYPEMRNMQMEPVQMQLRRQPAPAPDSAAWSHREFMSAWRASEQIETVEAVRIMMPRSDFEAFMSIYTAHYHAASKNPAVAEAWHQYKMLVALTG